MMIVQNKSALLVKIRTRARICVDKEGVPCSCACRGCTTIDCKSISKSIHRDQRRDVVVCLCLTVEGHLISALKAPPPPRSQLFLTDSATHSTPFTFLPPTQYFPTPYFSFLPSSPLSGPLFPSHPGARSTSSSCPTFFSHPNPSRPHPKSSLIYHGHTRSYQRCQGLPCVLLFLFSMSQTSPNNILSIYIAFSIYSARPPPLHSPIPVLSYPS